SVDRAGLCQGRQQFRALVQHLALMQFHHVRHPHPYRPAADLSGFYVIAVISNPARFMRRYELYWTFLEMCQAADMTVITVELALGERPFMVTEQGNPVHLRLR